MTNNVDYVIEKAGETYIMYSISSTGVSGDSQDYICQGTEGYCESVKNVLIQGEDYEGNCK